MLRANGITKNYGILAVLKGVDINIEKGEIVSIVGSSGAGKSTLLHILGTLDRPDKGSIFLHDQPVEKLKGKKLAAFRNKHIGFVFQFHHLLPENGGFLRIASTVEQHVDQLGDCLRDPAATRAETERFVASFIRPHGRDRAATPIFADVVEHLATIRPQPTTAPPLAPVLRLLTLVAAVPAFAVDQLRPQALARLRKRISSAPRRTTKRLKKAAARWKRLIP